MNADRYHSVSHISTKGNGGFPMCNSRNAIMSVSADAARSGEYVLCKRCEAKLKKIDAMKARRAMKCE